MSILTVSEIWLL